MSVVVAGQFLRQDLERHLAVQLRIGGLIDLVVCRNSAAYSRGLSIVEIEQSAETLPTFKVCLQTDGRRCSLKKLVLATRAKRVPGFWLE